MAASSLLLMYDDAEADGVVVRGLTGGVEGERAGDGLEVAVAGEHRVVIELEDADIYVPAGAYIQPTAEFQCEARHLILHDVVELREGAHGLPLPVCVARCADERVRERLDAPTGNAIVLHLHAAQEVVESFPDIDGLGHAAAEVVHELLGFEVARHVALDAEVAR